MKLSEIFSDLKIIQVDRVLSNDCDPWVRLSIESSTSPMLWSVVDVVDEIYLSIDESEFWNGKRVDLSSL